MIRTNLTILTVLVSTCWCFLRHVRFLSRVGLKLRITLVFRVVANDFLHSMSVTRLNLVATQSKVSKIHVINANSTFIARALTDAALIRDIRCVCQGVGGGGGVEVLSLLSLDNQENAYYSSRFKSPAGIDRDAIRFQGLEHLASISHNKPRHCAAVAKPSSTRNRRSNAPT